MKFVIEDIFSVNRYGIVVVMSGIDINPMLIGGYLMQNDDVWKIISMEKFSTCFGHESNRWGFQIELVSGPSSRPIPGVVEYITDK